MRIKLSYPCSEQIILAVMYLAHIWESTVRILDMELTNLGARKVTSNKTSFLPSKSFPAHHHNHLQILYDANNI
jgi:quercetin dioxygenase-like cupin family protein